MIAKVLIVLLPSVLANSERQVIEMENYISQNSTKKITYNATDDIAESSSFGHEDSLICTLFKTSVDVRQKSKLGQRRQNAYGNQSIHDKKPQWRCEIRGFPGKRFELDVPGYKFKYILEGSKSGQTKVQIWGALLRGNRITISDLANVQIIATQPTEIENKKTGVRTVLVLRVQAEDRSVINSREEISKNIFGPEFPDQCGIDIVNLRSQFLACSYGKLRLEPAPGVRLGVVNLPILARVTGQLRRDIENIARNTAIELGLPVVSTDHVMICIPQGTLDEGGSSDWRAYGELNGKYSVYNDERCNYVSYHMHEIGHNLNLDHSGDQAENTGQDPLYGDQTGIMGLSYDEFNGPKMCFNAAKSWQLGWYAGCTAVYDMRSLSNAWRGRLIGIADYDNGKPCSNFDVVLKVIEPGTGKDLYLTYNRAKGINSGTKESNDLVTVVRGGPDTEEFGADGLSNLLFSLDEGQTCALTNFGNSRRDLVISVINIKKTGSTSFYDEPDHAIVCLTSSSSGVLLPPVMKECVEQLFFKCIEKEYILPEENDKLNECRKSIYNSCRETFLYTGNDDGRSIVLIPKDADEAIKIFDAMQQFTIGSSFFAALGSPKRKEGNNKNVHNRGRRLAKCDCAKDLVCDGKTCVECTKDSHCNGRTCQNNQCVASLAIRDAGKEVTCLGIDATCGVLRLARSSNSCSFPGEYGYGYKEKTGILPTFLELDNFICPSASTYCFYRTWAKQEYAAARYYWGQNDFCRGSIESKAIWKFCEAFVGSASGFSDEGCACDCATYVQNCCAPQLEFNCEYSRFP